MMVLLLQSVDWYYTVVDRLWHYCFRQYILGLLLL